jgi:outer membrane biosynthesis protein TonB
MKKLLIAASAGLFGLAACSKAKAPVLDDKLQADLAAATGDAVHSASGGDIQLAPSSARSQMIDAEDAPTSAPQKAAVKRTPRPTPKPAPKLAANRTPEQAPAPAPQVTVTPSAPEPQPVIEQPAPAPAPVMRPQPAPAQQPDRRVYKTEGEIFKQMPWIRP